MIPSPWVYHGLNFLSTLSGEVHTWIEAVNGIRNGGNNTEYVITVTGTISVPPSTESTFGSVTDIIITVEGSGTLSPSSNGNLFIIGNGQTVIAKNVTLRGRSENGSYSVIAISRGGTFSMEGNATVTGNSRTGNGGGVYVDGGTFIMQDTSSVSGNTANTNSSNGGGGGVFVNSGTLTMRGNSTVSVNTAFSGYRSWGDYGGGGGVLVNGGTFTIQESATVSGNSARGLRDSSNEIAPVFGGGIYIVTGTFTMEGGTISNNTAEYDWTNSGGGSGVCNRGGTFIMAGGSIFSNAGSSGIENRGNFTMRGNATVSGNRTSRNGGGVSNSGTFIMEGNSSVLNNTANFGGGVYGNLTMQDSAVVSGNTAAISGGGVYVRESFIMRGNATISGNTATYGGGVYNGGTFAMESNATVSGNIAKDRGGGVYIGGSTDIFGSFSGGTFTKTGGNIFGDDADQDLRNTAISSMGHAVFGNPDRLRNASVGPTMNPDSYGFWLNEVEVISFPSNFVGTWKRSNFSNTLTITQSTLKSSSSNNVWVLQRISGDSYTMKRSDAANTITIIMRRAGSQSYNYLEISGDSGSGQDNWNGSWRIQE